MMDESVMNVHLIGNKHFEAQNVELYMSKTFINNFKPNIIGPRNIWSEKNVSGKVTQVKGFI